MASESSIHGSRKSASSMPVLTGKSIIQIVNFLYRGDPEVSIHEFNDESVLLTGILFCGLWREGNSAFIDSRWYNMSFQSSNYDSIECVRLYLEENDIDGDLMEDLIETSFEEGYLQYIPPFYGKVDIENPDGSKLSGDEKYEIFFSAGNNEKTQNIMDYYSLMTDGPVTWYQIIYDLLHIVRDEYIDMFYRGPLSLTSCQNF